MTMPAAFITFIFSFRKRNESTAQTALLARSFLEGTADWRRRTREAPPIAQTMT